MEGQWCPKRPKTSKKSNCTRDSGRNWTQKTSWPASGFSMFSLATFGYPQHEERTTDNNRQLKAGEWWSMEFQRHDMILDPRFQRLHRWLKLWGPMGTNPASFAPFCPDSLSGPQSRHSWWCNNHIFTHRWSILNPSWFGLFHHISSYFAIFHHILPSYSFTFSPNISSFVSQSYPCWANGRFLTSAIGHIGNHGEARRTAAVAGWLWSHTVNNGNVWDYDFTWSLFVRVHAHTRTHTYTHIYIYNMI